MKLKDVPFIADKGYDAVDIIRKVTELGFVPAISDWLGFGFLEQTQA